MTRYFTALVVLSVLAISAYADDLPAGVKNSQNPQDVSLTPKESLAKIQVPEGFRVTLFAGEPDLRRPIAFDFDDRGRIWVAEAYSHPVRKEGQGSDRILILEDTDHDGQFDKRTVFWDKGTYVSGLVYGHGGVWVGDAPNLLFIPDRNRDDVPDSEPIVKLDGFQVTSNNMLNNFHWGPDGWLYGAVGFKNRGYVGPPGTPKEKRSFVSRGIWRYHPVRSEFEELANGMVNPWGADFNQFGDLITANTVIAHLWHIVPGMHAQRRGTEAGYPYAYERIQTIADHLHWGGGTWQSSRKTTDQHNVAGGGHAHCGGMIYYGDNWPEEYRGTFITGNLHGNRLNNDVLTRKGSSYVATHRPDFFFANDPWFRSLTQNYGPDGGVYISDWHDFGECHDTDGSHRTSGRLYKMVFGASKKLDVDLPALSNSELVALQTHKNEWFVRRSRRILQERFAPGADDTSQVAAELRDGFENAKHVEQKLRYLWTEYVVGGLDESRLIELCGHADEHIRCWAVKLLVDGSRPIDWNTPWNTNNSNPPSSRVVEQLVEMTRDSSPKVRLAVVSSLRQIPVEQRWAFAESLLSNPDNEADDYLRLITWYMLEPLVAKDVERALHLAMTSKMPTFSRFAARRATALTPSRIELVLDLAQKSGNHELLHGVLAELSSRKIPTPSNWSRIRGSLKKGNAKAKEMASRLSIAFGDKVAVRRLRAIALDSKQSAANRISALETLAKIDGSLNRNDLHQLIQKDTDLRSVSLRLVENLSDESTAALLLASLSKFSDGDRRAAINGNVEASFDRHFVAASDRQRSCPTRLGFRVRPKQLESVVQGQDVSREAR